MAVRASDWEQKGNVTSVTSHLSRSVTNFVTNNREWRKRSVTSSIRQYLWDRVPTSIGPASLYYRSSAVSHLRRVTSDSAVDCLSLAATVLSEHFGRCSFRRKTEGRTELDTTSGVLRILGQIVVLLLYAKFWKICHFLCLSVPGLMLTDQNTREWKMQLQWRGYCSHIRYLQLDWPLCQSVAETDLSLLIRLHQIS
jgi:hypothetical protein